MPFEFKELEIPGIILIKSNPFFDERGFFVENYKKSEFGKNGIPYEFIQDNHSSSIKGVLRGLHYQKNPFPQGKLVKCVYGEIFDVAVDIRKNSPTFGKWIGVFLSDKNNYMLWIPPGFAHGFLSLSNHAEVIYKVSHNEYSPEYDAGIRWNDSTIGIRWPLDLVEKTIISKKDSNLPLLTELSKKDLL